MVNRRRPRSPGSVTITTVAQRAGVSVATVSRVMNGISTVDKELARRVREAAAEVGYRPNAVAQGLARGSLRTLGVVVPNLANPYFYEILKSIEASARRHSFRMLVADSGEDPDEEMTVCEWFASQVDCMVLCSPRMSTAGLEQVKALTDRVVMTNRLEESLSIAAVCADPREAVRDLGQHLAEFGHRRAVYLGGPQRSWANRERRFALGKMTDLELTSVESDGATIAHGYEAMASALDSDPTVVVAFNDLIAFGALARLRELGIEVPRDISLVGFDDIPFSRYSSPALTSVRNPHELIGRHAWELVERKLDGDSSATVRRVPSELIRRESTGPASR